MSQPAHHDKRDVFTFYEADTADRGRRLVYPHEDVTNETTAAFTRLREQGKFTVLVDGAFDVPHANHEWYLRHCRSLGAAALLEKHNTPQTPENIKWAMGSGAIKLAVTVDADYKVSHKKSGKSEKGGVQRPIYPWQARAERVASYMYRTGAAYQPVVDLVTVEGDEDHAGTALESSLTLAHHLTKDGLLDALVVYGEHGRTVDEAHSLGLDPIVIPDSTDYVINPQTGLAWSSSDIIKRAQGVPVLNPITRPEISTGAELLPT